MPRQTREERNAAKAAAGARYGRWLAPKMAARRLGPTEMVQRAADLGATLDKGSVSHYAAGDYPPDPQNAALIARILGEDPTESLREAGHGAIVEALSGRDPVIAMLDSIGMPQVTDPIAQAYLADLEAARERAREQADRVKREHEAANG